MKKVEDYGIFIEIVGSKLSGLCHKSEVCVHVLFPCTLDGRLSSFPTIKTRTSRWLFAASMKATGSRPLSSLSTLRNVVYPLVSSHPTLKRRISNKMSPKTKRGRSFSLPPSALSRIQTIQTKILPR